jgi:hypothetical protein
VHRLQSLTLLSLIQVGLVAEKGSNAVKLWIFNPQKKLKKKYTTILKKNKENLINVETLMKNYCGRYVEDLLGTRSTLEDVNKV